MAKRILAAVSAAVPRLRRLVRQRDRLLAQNHRLNEDVDRLIAQRDEALRRADEEARIPRLPAMDAHAAQDLDFLFIVTYGRSGSTLLMSLLDSLPGYCIRGENGGVLYKLFEYHSIAAEARTTWSTGDDPLPPQHPWYGIDGYPSPLATTRMRQLVLDTLLRPEPGTRVSGFKEIRWWLPKPVEYLDFIETLFPGARFILNTRDLEQVAKSRWWRNKPNGVADLAAVEARLRDTVARRGDRGYHVHFNDYVKDPSVLRGLYEWLGEDYDAEQVAKILAVRHSL